MVLQWQSTQLGHDHESRPALDVVITKYNSSHAYQVADALAWRGETDQAFNGWSGLTNSAMVLWPWSRSTRSWSRCAATRASMHCCAR